MKTQILVIGRNDEILKILDRLINKNENWQGYIANNDEKAIELFQQYSIDLVLLSSGIPEESEQKLRKLFSIQDANVSIVQHYGGGSGLLENEILEALSAKRQSVFNFNDNPFSDRNNYK